MSSSIQTAATLDDLYRVEGKAEGLAVAILKILESRGVAVSAAQREEISRCHDLDRLDRWLSRATLASSADEVT